MRKIPLLKGEGGAQRRVRGKEIPVPLTRLAGASHPLPSGEGFTRKISLRYCGVAGMTVICTIAAADFPIVIGLPLSSNGRRYVASK